MQDAPIGQRAPVFAPTAPAPLPWAQDQDRGKDDQKAEDKKHPWKVARYGPDFKAYRLTDYCLAAQLRDARLRV